MSKAYQRIRQQKEAFFDRQVNQTIEANQAAAAKAADQRKEQSAMSLTTQINGGTPAQRKQRLARYRELISVAELSREALAELRNLMVDLNKDAAAVEADAAVIRQAQSLQEAVDATSDCVARAQAADQKAASAGLVRQEAIKAAHLAFNAANQESNRLHAEVAAHGELRRSLHKLKTDNAELLGLDR